MGEWIVERLFSFISTQRQAIVVVCLLLLLVVIYKNIPQRAAIIETSAYDSLLNAPIKKQYTRHQKKTFKKFVKRRDSLFLFDPNTVTDKDLLLLGFNKGQISSINKFRSKAHFYSAADFSKLYVINAVQFKRLEPYIRIKDRLRPKKIFKKYQKQEIVMIELNSADSIQLQSLPLIGVKRAQAILKYRNRLGGFHAINQLSEVFGLSDSVIQIIGARIYIDSTKIDKLNINTATFKDFQRHPYIGYENAKRIMNYRRIKGHITAIKELLTDKIFEPNEANKMLIYLKVE